MEEFIGTSGDSILEMNQTNITEQLVGSSTFDPVTSLLIPLLISIIGAFCGAYFGLRFARKWDRMKKDEEIKSTKKLVVENILEEIRDLKNLFNIPNYRDLEWDETKQAFTGGYISIAVPIFQGLVNSGNFSLLPTHLQTEIGRVYLTVERCIFFTDQMLNFYTVQTGTHKNMEGLRISQELKRKRIELQKEVETIIPKLESFLNSLQTGTNPKSTTIQNNL